MRDLSPEAVVKGFFGALAAHDFPRAAGAIAEDCRWESLGTGAIHSGPTPIVAGLRDFLAGFPDWDVRIERLSTIGEIVIVEWETSGTFSAPFRGEAPNGKRFHRLGCAIAEVRGGKIRRYRDYYDRATLLEQLGLIHLLAGPKAPVKT